MPIDTTGGVPDGGIPDRGIPDRGLPKYGEVVVEGFLDVIIASASSQMRIMSSLECYMDIVITSSMNTGLTASCK